MIRRILLAASALGGAYPGRTGCRFGWSPMFRRPAFTWSGFFISAHTCRRLVPDRQSFIVDRGSPTRTPPDYSLDPHFSATNVIGGALVGYNYQMGATVVGLEGDIGFTNGKSSVTSAKAAVPLDVWYAANNLEQDINGHVRARVGWTVGRLMMFAAGGVAITDSKLNVVGYCPPDIYYGKASQTLVGFSIGAGVEYALPTDHIPGSGRIFVRRLWQEILLRGAGRRMAGPRVEFLRQSHGPRRDQLQILIHASSGASISEAPGLSWPVAIRASNRASFLLRAPS